MYWEVNEHGYLVLSRLARDLLFVPATGAGVERLFHSARYICHYRRGSLSESSYPRLDDVHVLRKVQSGQPAAKQSG